MDTKNFDAIAKRFAQGSTRRETVRRLLAGAAAAAVGVAGISGGSARPKATCKKPGALCSSSKQCCPKETNRKCKVANNAGNSDTTCCGVADAVCGPKNNDGDDTAPFCCVNHDCVNRRCRRAA